MGIKLWQDKRSSTEDFIHSRTGAVGNEYIYFNQRNWSNLCSIEGILGKTSMLAALKVLPNVTWLFQLAQIKMDAEQRGERDVQVVRRVDNHLLKLRWPDDPQIRFKHWFTNTAKAPHCPLGKNSQYSSEAMTAAFMKLWQDQINRQLLGTWKPWTPTSSLSACMMM